MPWGRPNKTKIFLMICRTLAVTRSWILVSCSRKHPEGMADALPHTLSLDGYTFTQIFSRIYF